MYRTRDDLVRVEVVKTLAHAIFPACDASVVPAIADHLEFRALMHNLFNAPTDKHVVLVLARQRRSQTLKVLENLAKVQDWTFLDSVTISYEKTVQSNASSFVKNSETGFLFYKGDFPNLDRTQWFNPDYCNATTTWALTPQPEEPVRATAFQRFSWEMLLLLVTLSQPLHYGRFAYCLDPKDENILHFVVYHQIPIQLYAESEEQATEIIANYEKIKEKTNPRLIEARRRQKLAVQQQNEEGFREAN